MECYDVLYKKVNENIVPVFDGDKLRKWLNSLFPSVNISKSDADKIMMFYYYSNRMIVLDNNRLYLSNVNDLSERLVEITLSDILEELKNNDDYRKVYDNVNESVEKRYKYHSGMKFTQELLEKKHDLAVSYLQTKLSKLLKSIRKVYGVSENKNDCYLYCGKNHYVLVVGYQDQTRKTFVINEKDEKLNDGSNDILIDIREKYWSDIKKQIFEEIEKNSSAYGFGKGSQ